MIKFKLDKVIQTNESSFLYSNSIFGTMNFLLGVEVDFHDVMNERTFAFNPSTNIEYVMMTKKEYDELIGDRKENNTENLEESNDDNHFDFVEM